MLGLLCAPTPKPWIVSSLSSSHLNHSFAGVDDRRNRRTAESEVQSWIGRAEVSVWHAITPGGGEDWRRDCLVVDHQVRQRGEGSWNVAWDARPARWTHRLDLAWLLFGVCAFLAPVDWNEFLISQESKADEEEVVVAAVKEKEEEEVGDGGGGGGVVGDGTDVAATYRVTGVLADGRCLFRALAHGACLQTGQEAPDGNRQTELADELRSRVVDELLKRRKETEWFIEGDFDAYVKRIVQPYNWGGEPELLMASHVLRTPIAVYMKDKSSGDLTNIANYGEEYKQEKEFPVNVLFHGYGHYDIVETSLNQSCCKKEADI